MNNKENPEKEYLGYEVTEKQVLALVLQTVGEANNIENIQYL